MKRLGVSYKHGPLYYWNKIENILPTVNEIFHLGDVLYHGPRNPLPKGYDPKNLSEELKKHKINYIRGNCDADVDLKVLGIQEMPKQTFEFFGNYSIFMIHGEIIKLAKSHNAKIILHGHTHIPKIEKKDDIILANPGSLSLPKENNKPTYMILDFKNKLKITIFTVDGDEVNSIEI